MVQDVDYQLKDAFTSVLTGPVLCLPQTVKDHALSEIDGVPFQDYLENKLKTMEGVADDVVVIFATREEADNIDAFYDSLPQAAKDKVTREKLNYYLNEYDPGEVSNILKDLDGDGKNDLAVIRLADDHEKTALEQAAYMSQVAADNLRDIPGTDKEWYTATVLHEFFHTGHPNFRGAQPGFLLSREVNSDQNMCNALKTEAPEVAKAYLGMRAIYSFEYVKGKMGYAMSSHTTNGAVISYAGDAVHRESESELDVGKKLYILGNIPYQASLSARLPSRDKLRLESFFNSAINDETIEQDVSGLIKSLSPETQEVYEQYMQMETQISGLQSAKEKIAKALGVDRPISEDQLDVLNQIIKENNLGFFCNADDILERTGDLTEISNILGQFSPEARDAFIAQTDYGNIDKGFAVIGVDNAAMYHKMAEMYEDGAFNEIESRFVYECLVAGQAYTDPNFFQLTEDDLNTVFTPPETLGQNPVPGPTIKN